MPPSVFNSLKYFAHFARRLHVSFAWDFEILFVLAHSVKPLLKYLIYYICTNATKLWILSLNL